MDKNHVVALTRTVSGAPSRRDAVRGLAALGIGLAMTRPPAPVEATHFICRHAGKRCNGGAQCCSGICKRHKCRAHDRGRCKAGQDGCITTAVVCGAGSFGICNCLVTTGKASFCALNDATATTCTRDEECVASKGEGAACVVCGDATFCAPRCPEPT
jgi:hypothetical protein